MQEELGEVVYVVALFDAPTIAQFAGYLRKNYRAAVEQLLGAAVPGAPEEDAQHGVPLSASRVRQMRDDNAAPAYERARGGREEQARGLRAVAAALGLDAPARHARRPPGAVRAARA